MMYKVEYQYEDDQRPHNRFYTALNADTAKAMFKETCEESLGGCRVRLVGVCEVEANSSESSYAKFCAEDTNRKH